MKTISLYLFIALSPFFSFAQVFQCGDGWSTHMEVNATSGLKLRAEPNLDSKTLAIIPHESVIAICYPAEINANIDGIQGHWVLAEYKEQRGYVFDGYLEGVATEPLFAADCVAEFVNSWDETYFSKNEEYLGLFKNEGRDNFEIRPVKFEEEHKEELYKGSKNQEIPIWLFSHIALPMAGQLKGKIIDRQLNFGEQIRFGDATVYAFGKLAKQENQLNYFLQYAPYELRLRSKKGEKILDQLLIKTNHYPDLGYVMIRFIGDLDRDGIDDIIFTHSMEGKGWDHVFASSRYAAPHQLYRTFHIGGGSD